MKNALLNEAKSPLTNLKEFFTDFIEKQENVLNCSKGYLMGYMTMELADVNEPFQEIFRSTYILECFVCKPIINS